MDDRGNLFYVDEKSKTKTNMETGKTLKLNSKDSIKLTEIPEKYVEQLKAMNRKERRVWLNDYKNGRIE